MKKIIIAIMCVFCIVGAYAENANISTSQYYVDTNAATKQDAVPANNANTVMTYDSTANSGIGTKAIYDTSSSYDGQIAALMTADTANAAIQKGINSEFTCANPPKCNLWNMSGIYPTIPQTLLPNGYTAVEYITNKGECWFSTTIPWSNVANFRGKAQARITDINNKAILGSSIHLNASASQFYGFVYYSSTDVTQWYWNTGIPATRMAEFDISYIDDKYTGTINGIHTETTQSKYVGNVYIMNSYGNDNRSFNGRVWYIQLFGNDGNMIFNGIPARRESDNKVGFYDTVSNSFLTNNGNGNCVAGGIDDPEPVYVPEFQ